MAAAHFAQMGSMPNMLKNDLDMDTFFDFNQGTQSLDTRSPSRASTRTGPSTQPQQQHSAYDDSDERLVFAGPSHEYDRFKQQTGIPVGDVAGFSHLNQPINNNNNNFGGFNSGIDDMSFGVNDSWSTGIDMDADINMDFGNNMPPTMFYQQDNRAKFVDPNSIDNVEEPQSNVGRLWPGMHQQQAQQAAHAKARAQQQRQQQIHQQQMQIQMQQHQQHQHQQQQAKGKQRAPSSKQDPHTEESISRLLNQMRQNSHVSTMGDDDDDSSFMPNIARMKKDEEEMDEDERLLASEEGKKLSSKERRQLRNKVSARAFRSRRKEYIGQLEGEVAVKAQECSTLKSQNNVLVEENERYRALIQTLLRHPSFTPFIEDFSKDPAFIAARPRQQQVSAAPTPVPSSVPSSAHPQHAKPQQMQMKREGPHGMSMIPETPVDLSMLHINNGNFQMQQQQQQQQNPNYDFQQPQIFAAHHIPQGPSPLDLALDLVKQSSSTDMNW